MSLSARRFKVLGHRGFSAKYPENTLLSLSKAIEEGADGFECDLRISRDNEVLVFHDDDFKRLCGSNGSIEESSWKEIKKLKVKNKEPICHFDQLVESFFGHHLSINLEIKESPLAPQLIEVLAKKLLALLESCTAQLMISSFSKDLLLNAKDKLRDPRINFSPILGQFKDPIVRSLKSADEVYSWNIHYSALKDFAADPTRFWAPVSETFWCWTANDSDAWKLIEKSPLFVEAVMTDHPDKLIAYENDAAS
ncbi:MAG: hypothetical protein COV44_00385 [Deltaproteobacteria bacterium CG11_big_fil_rev_8_21_14_0_20_45_16]|nr:MAG: hypothetical protein COV44_00385 [Deltaproteobacteria bacterium CG11_big_fil_rev_8_21_14_0_20_45_16]